MKIQLESKSLQDALGIAAKVAPSMDGNVSIQVKDNQVILHSTAEVSRCQLVIPAKVNAENCEFAIPLDAIRDATKGREELTLAWDGTLLKIKTGSYEAELLTSDAIQRDTLDKIEMQEVNLTTEQAAWLKSALGSVSLKPTALLSSYMPVSVKLTSKGAFIACFDNQHMAFLNAKDVTGETEFTLPIETLSTVLDVFKQSAIKMSIGSSRIELRNKLIKIGMQLPSMDGAISISDLVAKAREVRSTEGLNLTVSKAEVLAFMSNARSVTGKERTEIWVTSEKDGANFQVKTVRGTIKAKVKAVCKKKIEFKIDLEFFEELVGKNKSDELNLSIVEDAFIATKQDALITLVALNQ